MRAARSGCIADAAPAPPDRVEPLGDRRPCRALQDALADGDGDLVGLERAIGRETGVSPASSFLPMTMGAVAVVEQQLAHMRLDQRALFLDADDECRDPCANSWMICGIERPDHADLEQPHADASPPPPRRCRDRRAPGARRDSSCRPRRCRSWARAAAEDDLVEAVGAGEGDRGMALAIMQPLFLVEPVVIRADVEAARRHLEVARDDGLARGRGPPRSPPVDSTVSCTHLMPTHMPE